MDNKDLIKALRCMASQDEYDECYQEKHNAKNAENRIACISENIGIYNPCPFYQDTYGTCFENGEHCEWMGKVADLLEELEAFYQEHSIYTWAKSKEELPVEGSVVLVQVNGQHGNIIFLNAILMAEYNEEEGWLLNDYPEFEDKDIEVVAWMPLPEVWEG